MATFKTSARLVDLLGRQQIHGIPTAISELFKNAHDAYATRVEVDYFKYDPRRILYLRDNGVGMTEEEFFDRWLTVGTDSKVRGSSGRPYAPPDMSPRTILGEKGIGRLAVAVMGPTVLVLTRAVRGETRHPIVAALIHWELFSIPGLKLEDIPVPTVKFENVPDRKAIRGLRTEIVDGVERLKPKIGLDRAASIRLEVEKFDVDPAEDEAFLSDRFHGSPSLSRGSGTWFVVAPTDGGLDADLAPPPEDPTEAPALDCTLLGFTDQLAQEGESAPLATAFRIHHTQELCEDRFEERAFFSLTEFNNADHTVVGQFDESGQFSGKVSVYGDTVSHVIPWPDGRGDPTRCGPFSIAVAMVQGTSRETTLPFDEWTALTNKMDLYGGLYIYRDGIRVQPYGNFESDWLGVEKRRTKKASYYYFSFRRMFGSVTLKSPENSELKEKAGREGFQRNLAYRQFRGILIAFFKQLAQDFFRKGSDSPYVQHFEKRKAELAKHSRALERREQQKAEKKRALAQALDAFSAAVDQDEASKRCECVKTWVQEQLAIARQETGERLAAECYRIETEARKTLDGIREQAPFKVVVPRGVALPRALAERVEDYRAKFQELGEAFFRPALAGVESMVADMAKGMHVALDRRRRVEASVVEVERKYATATRSAARETAEKAKHLGNKVRERSDLAITDVSKVVSEVKAEVARTDLSALSDDELAKQRSSLESRIQEAAITELSLLEALRERISYLTEALDSGDPAQLESALLEAEAMDHRIMELEERSDLDMDLVQVGMAIDVVNHEFENSIRSIRNQLGAFRAWADRTKGLMPVYKGIRDSFEHLDGYLTMFTPLNRRLYRKKVTISGSAVADYLAGLFLERFRRHSIRLTATEGFRRASFFSYPSTFYPVFVNLVDNAVYWLKGVKGDRTITLDVDGEALLVRDNGPGVAPRDREAIFEWRFSRKPGGRGLGLPISREALKKVDWSLELDEPAPGKGACFRLAPPAVAPVESEEGSPDA